MTSRQDEHAMGGDDGGLGRLVDRLKHAELAVELAHRDFARLRGTLDSAGELVLWERVESAERTLQEAIAQLDAIVAQPSPGD